MLKLQRRTQPNSKPPSSLITGTSWPSFGAVAEFLFLAISDRRSLWNDDRTNRSNEIPIGYLFLRQQFNERRNFEVHSRPSHANFDDDDRVGPLIRQFIFHRGILIRVKKRSDRSVGASLLVLALPRESPGQPRVGLAECRLVVRSP